MYIHMYNFGVVRARTHARTHADSIPVSGRFWSPRVFSAYYTPFSKSRRFLTLINAFLRLRRKKAWDGKNFCHRGNRAVHRHALYVDTSKSSVDAQFVSISSKSSAMSHWSDEPLLGFKWFYHGRRTAPNAYELVGLNFACSMQELEYTREKLTSRCRSRQ